MIVSNQILIRTSIMNEHISTPVSCANENIKMLHADPPINQVFLLTDFLYIDIQLM